MEGRTDARMNGRMDEEMQGPNACHSIAGARCTLLKSDNRFYSIFLQCRKRFKNFSPPARQKSKKKILETFNAVAAAATAVGFVFSSCLLFLSLHISLALSFSNFSCSCLDFSFFSFFLPTRDVQKLNGNQHITSGKICVNKVAGVVAHRRPFATPIRLS